MPDAVSTLTGGAAMLMSVQGVAGVRYIPPEPMSTMEVSVFGSLSYSVIRLRGERLHL